MKAILLDVDDTLMNFRKCSYNALKKTMAKFSLKMDDDFFDMFSSYNEYLWSEYASARLSRNEVLYGRWEHLLNVDSFEFEKDFQSFLGQEYVLFDDAIEILEYLYSKYDLYVVSNGVMKGQLSRLKLSQIDKYFKNIYISEAIGYPKPERKFFDFCLKDINCDLDDILIIGDSLEADMIGGINAGIHTCFVNRNHIETDLKIDFEVHCLSDIKKYI